MYANGDEPLAVGAPERVSRLLMNSRRGLQGGEELPDIIDQLSVALVRMSTQKSRAAAAADDDDDDETTELDDERLAAFARSIVESHDDKLADGLAMCASFAAHDGLSSTVLASGVASPAVWSWDGKYTLEPLILFLTHQPKDTDDNDVEERLSAAAAVAAAVAPLFAHLSLQARASLIAAGAGPALISSLGVSSMSSAFAEELGRVLAEGQTVPAERVAYARWLTEQIVLAANESATMTTTTYERVGTTTTGEDDSSSAVAAAATATAAVIGTAASVGPLGTAMSTLSILIPRVVDGGLKGTPAEDAVAALAVEGLAALARVNFALLARVFRYNSHTVV